MSRQSPPRASHALSWLLAVVLTLTVVILGAYTRLSDAGLGCPDWPGCYGHLAVPASPDAVARANDAFAHRPVESSKAWKEMVHRYAAGLLGLAVLALAVSAWRRGADRRLATGTLLLIVFQAALGMWTVTLLLKPVVVMGHLLGGFGVLSLLWLGYLNARSFVPERRAAPPYLLRRLAFMGIVVLVVQIALGGWTSANYAALACPTFPKCMGEWWPPMDMKDGFVLWRGLGVNYEFGVLDSPARVAVHMAHRAWAVVTFLYLGALAIAALRQTGPVRAAAAVMLLLLLGQVSLGIANVWLSLPLAVAAAHNAVAALLLLALLTLTHILVRRTSRG